jgi:hypothetical protein
VTLDRCLDLGSIKQVSLYNGNPIPKGLQAIRIANKGRHHVTVFNRLPDDLHANPPGRA